MSNFTFKLGDQSFEIKMPSGADFEQAKSVFDQQVKSGGLVGFSVGDAVNAATQAASGLATAAAGAQQGISSALGKLPQGADLKTLTDSVGPAGAAAMAQAQAAFAGSGPAIASMTTGSSAAINSAISGASSIVPSGFSNLTAVIPTGITGQFAQIGSIANNAIKSISGALSGSPTNGINVTDFVKQGPSLGDIGNLTKSMVTGVMAQANKLIGQGPGDLTNAAGLGKFGFDAKQLETAGFLKPGTAAAFLKTGDADLTAVLSSPLPWTGKDGVKGVTDLLSNGKLQDKIQQGLMSSGLSSVNQLGLPTDKLTPAALGGVATLAAKDPAAAVASLTGKVPGDLADNLGSFKDKVTDVMSNSAFAVKLTEDKVEPALKQEEPAPAETNTVDSATVNAAGERIVGNDKVPSVSTSATSSAAEIAVMELFDFVNRTNTSFDSLATVTQPLLQRNSITQDQFNTANEEYQVIRATYNSRKDALIDTATAEIKKLNTSDPNYTRLVELYNSTISKLIPLTLARNKTVKEIIASLANKIVT